MQNNAPQLEEIEERIKEYLNVNDLNDLDVELSEEEFGKFSEFLERQGLRLHDTWENELLHADRHRIYMVVDEYEDDGIEVQVFYKITVWNDNTHYVINKIKIIEEN